MNTLKNIVTAAVVAATALTTLGAAAQAGDWRGRGYGYGYGYAPAPRHYAPAPRAYYGHGYDGRRDRRGDRIAAGVAIGVGAVILGSILASQNRNHYRGY